MSMNFQIVRYNFISQKVRKPLRIVMIADLHNQVYGLENTDLLTAIDTEQPDIILLPGDMIVCRKSERKNNRVTADTIRKMTEIAPVYYSYGNHERGLLECVRETDGIWQEYSQHLKGAHHLHMLVNAHEFLEPWNVCLYGLDLRARITNGSSRNRSGKRCLPACLDDAARSLQCAACTQSGLFPDILYTASRLDRVRA